MNIFGKIKSVWMEKILLRHAQLAGNAKSGHFSTFSNGTPYIYYVHSSYVYEKGKKGKKNFFWIC